MSTIKIASLIFLLLAMPAGANTYRYDDRDPVEIEGTPPAAYPIHGIDVSRYQESIDWDAVRSAGIQFAYLKATEGQTLVDAMYVNHVYAAYRAGVRVGAYHFYHFCSSPEAQAALFSRVVERSDGWLPPVVDLEWAHQSSCKRRPSRSEIQNEITRFNAAMVERYGMRPIIYTNPGFYEDAGLSIFRDTNEFWMRSVRSNPHVAYDGHPWTFWQYTGSGRIPGIRGNVDINVFQGDEKAWAHWVRERTVKGIDGVW